MLDPFAGWGTTLVVAQRLGRAVGVELTPERIAAIKRRVSPAAVPMRPPGGSGGGVPPGKGSGQRLEHRDDLLR